MSGRPRKGRPVAFAPITPERSQPDPVLGLKFTIEARHGGTVLVDMTGLDPRPLAIAFAGALRRSAALGGPIGAASVIKQYVQVYRHFFAWLGDDAPEVTGESVRLMNRQAEAGYIDPAKAAATLLALGHSSDSSGSSDSDSSISS